VGFSNSSLLEMITIHLVILLETQELSLTVVITYLEVTNLDYLNHLKESGLTNLMKFLLRGKQNFIQGV
jgi:hypothetical protein